MTVSSSCTHFQAPVIQHKLSYVYHKSDIWIVSFFLDASNRLALQISRLTMDQWEWIIYATYNSEITREILTAVIYGDVLSRRFILKYIKISCRLQSPLTARTGVLSPLHFLLPHIMFMDRFTSCQISITNATLNYEFVTKKKEKRGKEETNDKFFLSIQ